MVKINPLDYRFNKIIKIAFDYVLTIPGVVIITPVLFIIAICVFLEDPGPVIFAHIRIGKNGKAFPCYKFRTMHVNSQEYLEKLLANDAQAREEWQHNFKLKNDPRVTRIGSFLRKTSLDELPQIFNVLRGQMSLVGPRPVLQEELDIHYREFTDIYQSVKPGITGLWQVSGRSDTTYEERVQMDVWYVRNWSILLDITLLLRTITSVAKQEGAY